MPDLYTVFVFSSLTYVFSSFILFFYPNLLKKKKTYVSPIFNQLLSKNKILHISHRGGSREALENTIDAFDNALKIQSNMLEMDVCLTKDEEIVVVHDSYLNRLCNDNIDISKLNYHEIPKFADKISLHFSINKFYESKNCTTPYMPKLEEIFQKYPNTLINVELKNTSDLLIKKTENLIKKYNREHLTIWGTRHIIFTEKLIKQNKNIPIFFSMERLLLTYLYYITGLLPFVTIKESSMQLPLYTDEFKTWKIMATNGRSEKIMTHLFFGFVKMVNGISKPLFIHLKKRGILVFYWVVNDQNDFDRAVQSGCTGIMTDCPSLLKNYLKEKNLFV